MKISFCLYSKCDGIPVIGLRVEGTLTGDIKTLIKKLKNSQVHFQVKDGIIRLNLKAGSLLLSDLVSGDFYNRFLKLYENTRRIKIGGFDSGGRILVGQEVDAELNED